MVLNLWSYPSRQRKNDEINPGLMQSIIHYYRWKYIFQYIEILKYFLIKKFYIFYVFSRQNKNIYKNIRSLVKYSIISPYEFTTCHGKRHSIPPNILDEHCQTQNSCRSQLYREKSERMEYRSMNRMTKKKCGRCEDSSCDVRCRLFVEALCGPSVYPENSMRRVLMKNIRHRSISDLALAISAFWYFLYYLKKHRANKSRIPFAF